jgi:hypothetical protein
VTKSGQMGLWIISNVKTVCNTPVKDCISCPIGFGKSFSIASRKIFMVLCTSPFVPKTAQILPIHLHLPAKL